LVQAKTKGVFGKDWNKNSAEATEDETEYIDLSNKIVVIKNKPLNLQSEILTIITYDIKQCANKHKIRYI